MQVKLVDINELFGYNWHMRKEFLKSMSELPWQKLVESCGASFDSIRDIFIHSLQAEHFWIRNLTGKSTEGIFSTSFEKFTSIEAIKEYADNVEKETKEYLNTLTMEKLNSIFQFVGWDGKIRRHKVEDILIHVIEEEIHHRGELLCIYWQNDITPPHVGYLEYKSKTQKT